MPRSLPAHHHAIYVRNPAKDCHRRGGSSIALSVLARQSGTIGELFSLSSFVLFLKLRSDSIKRPTARPRRSPPRPPPSLPLYSLLRADYSIISLDSAWSGGHGTRVIARWCDMECLPFVLALTCTFCCATSRLGQSDGCESHVNQQDTHFGHSLAVWGEWASHVRAGLVHFNVFLLKCLYVFFAAPSIFGGR